MQHSCNSQILKACYNNVKWRLLLKGKVKMDRKVANWRAGRSCSLWLPSGWPAAPFWEVREWVGIGKLDLGRKKGSETQGLGLPPFLCQLLDNQRNPVQRRRSGQKKGLEQLCTERKAGLGKLRKLLYTNVCLFSGNFLCPYIPLLHLEGNMWNMDLGKEMLFLWDNFKAWLDNKLEESHRGREVHQRLTTSAWSHLRCANCIVILGEIPGETETATRKKFTESN